jgi:hypothetical protein
MPVSSVRKTLAQKQAMMTGNAVMPEAPGIAIFPDVTKSWLFSLS